MKHKYGALYQKFKKWQTENLETLETSEYFSEFSSSEFLILDIGSKWKSRKRKSWEKIQGSRAFKGF